MRPILPRGRPVFRLVIGHRRRVAERLALPVGAHSVVRAAWIRFPELTAEVLVQTYTHVSADRYVYESAGGTFRRELQVDAFGCVIDYPGIWRAEATAPLPMEGVRWR